MNNKATLLQHFTGKEFADRRCNNVALLLHYKDCEAFKHLYIKCINVIKNK